MSRISSYFSQLQDKKKNLIVTLALTQITDIALSSLLTATGRLSRLAVYLCDGIQDSDLIFIFFVVLRISDFIGGTTVQFWGGLNSSLAEMFVLQHFMYVFMCVGVQF